MYIYIYQFRPFLWPGALAAFDRTASSFDRLMKGPIAWSETGRHLNTVLVRQPRCSERKGHFYASQPRMGPGKPVGTGEGLWHTEGRQRHWTSVSWLPFPSQRDAGSSAKPSRVHFLCEVDGLGLSLCAFRYDASEGGDCILHFPGVELMSQLSQLSQLNRWRLRKCASMRRCGA